MKTIYIVFIGEDQKKQNIDALTAYTKIKQSNGKIMSILFTKRTTGEDRRMVCRTGVKKGVTGKGKSFNDLEKRIVTVFDIQKNAFRSINLDAVKEIKMEGKTFNCKNC